MKIGFIGLGNMGAPMARNLAASGHAVKGFDLAPREIPGVAPAASAIAAADGAGAVLTMLPDGAALRAVARDLLLALSPGALFIDCSTVDVAAARDVAEMAEARGLLAADAPVSGGIGGAEAGTLTFMVGGSDTAFAAATPLFDIMGSRAVHCGPSGNGQAAKLCNNMILGATMAVTCEAFALADRLGLDAQALYDVVSTSSGQSWSTTTYCPVPGTGPHSPADRDYAPGFATALMLKDLALAMEAARTSGADTPVGQSAHDLYARLVAAGQGPRDFSTVFPWFMGSVT